MADHDDNIYEEDDGLKERIREENIRETERAAEQAQRAAYEASAEGKARAWWNNLKAGLQGTSGKFTSAISFSQLGYYEFNEQTQKMEKMMLSGNIAPKKRGPEGRSYYSDFYAESAEPSDAQLINIQKAAEEGRLFFFQGNPLTGDKAFRIDLDENNRVEYEDFEQLEKYPSAPAKEPTKPAGVGFWNRVLSFFGNKAAREKVTQYNSDFNTYRTEKASWDRAIKGCKNQKEINKRVNANLIDEETVRQDLITTVDAHKLIKDALEGQANELDREQALQALDDEYVEMRDDHPEKDDEVLDDEMSVDEKVEEVETLKKDSGDEAKKEMPGDAKVEETETPKKDSADKGKEEMSAQEKLTSIAEKYANFNGKEITDVKGLKQLYEDNLFVVDLALKNENSDKKLASQAMRAGSKIFEIIANNKNDYKNILNNADPANKLDINQKINQVNKTVKVMQQHKQVDKTKEAAKKDLAKEDQPGDIKKEDKGTEAKGPGF
ncbi:MAG: hypothetical protein Q4E99_00240 [Bacillota bacterium]|nr:hypothetical protein [Bacillota bacterium]